VVGHQCHDVGLVIHHKNAFGNGGRFCHVLKLTELGSPSNSLSATTCVLREHVTMSLHSLAKVAAASFAVHPFPMVISKK